MARVRDPRYQPITKDDGLFINSDFSLQFTIYDETTRLPKDITGYTLHWVLAPAEGEAGVLTLIAVVANQVTSKGLCQADGAAVDTFGFTGGTYWYNLLRVNPGAQRPEAFGPAVLQEMSQ